MNHTKLVCYRGVNGNQTPITRKLIIEKSSQAAIYLASLIIKNNPERSSCIIDANNMANFIPDNELCTPLSCYAEVEKSNAKCLRISTSLYAGINEELIAHATTTIRCSDGSTLSPHTVSGIKAKNTKTKIDEIFKKYSVLNMDKVFKSYLTHCNIKDAIFTNPKLSQFEYRALLNFIHFSNSNAGETNNTYFPTLPIEQNILLENGNNFLTDTFCLNL